MLRYKRNTTCVEIPFANNILRLAKLNKIFHVNGACKTKVIKFKSAAGKQGECYFKHN